MIARRRQRQPSRGFVSVAALWMLAALAALVSIYAVYVTQSAAVVSANEDMLQTDALATAAVEIVAGRLLAVTPETRPGRGSLTLRMPAAQIDVSYRSEAARVDLNLASKELLAGLFARLGAGPLEADMYADRVIAWRSPAAGPNPEADPETIYYRSAGIIYVPRHAPFQHVNELWMLAGIPEVLIERVLPLVTVFSGRADVNILDAPPLALAALPGLTAERAQAILLQRAQPDVDPRTMLQLANDARGTATIENAKAMRLGMTIVFANGRRATVEAVILPRDDADEPYRVLSWRTGAGGDPLAAF